MPPHMKGREGRRHFCSPRWEAGGDGEREDRGGARVADADMRREGRGSPPGLGALGEEGAVTASCRGAEGRRAS